MYTEKELKKLSEKERELLLKKVVKETIAKIKDLEKSISNVSEVSVNSMSVRSNCRESIKRLLEEMSSVREGERLYYNYK
jgi:chromosome condensin MukBEF ATPase and DNA-binding subunit MukB